MFSNNRNHTINSSRKVKNTFFSNDIETPTKIKVNKNCENDLMVDLKSDVA